MEPHPIDALYRTLLNAWNHQDAAGMAACFCEEGVSIGFDGSISESARTIEAECARIFRDHPTGRFVALVRDIQPIGETGALLRAVAGMVPREAEAVDPALHAQQSLVAILRDGTWKVLLFQNTPAALHGRPEAVVLLTQELSAELADHPFA